MPLGTWRPDVYKAAADEAAQEACLPALHRIGQLHDPAAMGSWLRMLVRNVCRMQLPETGSGPTSWLGATTQGRSRRHAQRLMGDS